MRRAKSHTRVSKRVATARRLLRRASVAAAAVRESFRIPRRRSVRDEILWKIAEAQATAADVRGAHRTAALVRHDFNRSFALKSIAEAQIQRGEIAGALSTAEMIRPGYSTKSITMGKIAAALTKAGDQVGADRTLQEAIQASRDVRGMRLDCLWLIAEDLAEAGDVPGALRIAGAMPETDSKGRTLGSIARIQALAGDIRGAFSTASTIRDTSRKAMAFSLIATVLAERGNRIAAAKACRLARRAAAGIRSGPRKDYDIVSIVTLIAAAGDMRGALRMLAAVRTPYERACAFSVIANVQIKAGDRAAAASSLRRGLRVIAGMRSGGDKAHALGIYAEEQAEAGNVEEAIQIAAGLQSRAAKEWTLERIAAIRAQAGDVPGALGTVAVLKDRQKTYALGEIAIAQAIAGKTRGALQTALSIRDDAWKASAVRYVAAAQAKMGDANSLVAWRSRQTAPVLKASVLLGVAGGMLGLRDAEMARRKARRRAYKWRRSGRPATTPNPASFALCSRIALG